MKWNSWCLTLVLLQGFVWGDNRRREEQKAAQELRIAVQRVQFLRKQLAEAESKRWQDKRNEIAAQEAFQQEWGDLKRDVERSQQQKRHKEEMLLRLKTQKEEKESQVTDLKSRHGAFAALLSEKVRETETNLEGSIPDDVEKRMQSLARLKSQLESNPQNLNPVIARLFALQHELFLLGESDALSRRKMVIEGTETLQEANPEVRFKASQAARLSAGHEIRLGMFYKAFVSSEDSSVAMLVKTGKVGPESWQWTEEIPEESRQALRATISHLVANDSGRIQIPLDVLLTNAFAEGYLSKAQSSFVASIEKEIRAGGFAIFLILGTLFLGLLVSLERLIFYLLQGGTGSRLAEKVLRLARQGKVEEARQLVAKGSGAMRSILRSILDRSVESRAGAESKAYQSILKVSNRLDKRLSLVSVLAAAAPLLGLLGTVSGMINLFESITLYGIEDPSNMAGGISEALVTTKWGLLVAVPLLMIYTWLSSWAGNMTDHFERYSAELIGALYIYRPENALVNEEPPPMDSDSEKVPEPVA